MKEAVRFFVFLFLSCGCLGGMTQELLFRDQGFESCRKKYGNPYWWQIVSPKSGQAFSDKKVKRSGVYSMRAVVSEPGQKLEIRYLGGSFKTHPGVKYDFSLWAKGKGILNLAVKQQAERIGYVGNYFAIKLPDLRSEDFVLTEEWKQYHFTFALKNPAAFYMEFRIHLRGKDAAVYLDDADIKRLGGKNTLDLMTDCTVVKSSAPASFAAYGGKWNGEVKAFFHKELEKLNGKSKDVSPDGRLIVQTPAREGCYSFSLVDEKAGEGRRRYIHVLEKTHYERLEKISQTISNPGTVLVLGDSLSDYLRGYNWVDIVQDFCLKRFPGKTRFCNYAVGGDQAPRTLARLKGVKGTYALYRYKGIEKVKPDLILISLGHNDSLSLDRSKGAASPTQVPDAKFASAIREMVLLLRKQYPGAAIKLFTPYTMCLAKTRKHYFGNRKLMYGEPAIVARYAALIKSLGKELKCGVVDVYTPFMQLKDTAPYFMYDGIHLSLRGNLYASELILRSFKKGK